MANIFDLFKQISSKPEPSGPITWIVAGLGNPERQYEGTRHNVGFTFIDYCAYKYNISINRQKFHSLTGEATIGGNRILFLKPLTYMNKSGIALQEAMDFYKLPIEKLLIVFDDVSLAPGRLRVRRNGSAGGHNGVKSAIEYLNTDRFPRIKLGVGEKPHPEMDLGAWVLGHLSEEDGKAVTAAIKRAAEAMELILQDDIEKAMCQYNG